MAAQILSLARVPAPRTAAVPAANSANRWHVWRGASGRRYAHAVYGLIDCPALPKAAYLLVRRDGRGNRTVLHVGRADSDAPTLNLARVRQRGATLGANEVHVYALAGTDWERRLAICDLRAGQFGELAAEPSQPAGRRARG